jgi:hypothetical protein
LRAAGVKMTTLCDVAPCSLVEVDQSSRSVYCLQQEGDHQLLWHYIAQYTRRLSFLKHSWCNTVTAPLAKMRSQQYITLLRTIYWFQRMCYIQYSDAHTWIRRQQEGQTKWQESLTGFWRTLFLLNSSKGRFSLNRMNKHRKCVRIIHRGHGCVLHTVLISRTTVARLRNHGNTSFYLILLLDNWLQVWDLYKRGDIKEERERKEKNYNGRKHFLIPLQMYEVLINLQV